MLPIIVLVLSLVALHGATENDQQPQHIGNYGFRLYTRTSPTVHYLNVKNGSTIINSSYNPKKTTKFIGITSTQDVNLVRRMVKGLLQVYDVNVIVMETLLQNHRHQHNHYNYHNHHEQQDQQEQGQEQQQQSGQLQQQQGQGHNFKLVNVGIHEIPFPALSIYRLLTKLVGYGADSEQFHFIVYDQDANMAGIAAKLLYPHRIGRITALNPRQYRNAHAYLRVASTDALFVDGLWTCATGSQMSEYRMDTVFFVNNGTHPQPGVDQSNVNESCMRSVIYYAESIERPNSFLAKKVVAETDTNRMGEYAAPAYNSQYYLPTKDTYPYGYDDNEMWQLNNH